VVSASTPLAVDRHGLGEVVIDDTGFVLAREPDTLRGPDVAFVSRVSRERVDRLEDARHPFAGAPDLAVEILSPSDTPSAVHAKVADYLAAGAGFLAFHAHPARSLTRADARSFPARDSPRVTASAPRRATSTARAGPATRG
jgi:hypothetical protein